MQEQEAKDACNNIIITDPIQTVYQFAHELGHFYHVDAWINKGYALIELGKHDEAIKAFNKVIEIDSSLWQGWAGKGDVLLAQGRTAEANASFAKAKELGYEG